MFKELFRWITKLVWIAGFLLVLLLVLESIDLFFKFYAIHPNAGWGFASLLTLIFLSLFLYILNGLLRYPKALNAPELSPLEEASF